MFSDLVKVYQKADFSTKVGYADYFIENNDDHDAIEAVIRDSDVSRIEVINGSIEIGETLRLAIQQPARSLGWLYGNLDEFIISDFIKSVPDNLPFFIKEINFYSAKSNVQGVLQAYFEVKGLLNNLNKMSIYNNEASRKLVFAGKKTFELDYNVNHYRQNFIQLLRDLSDNKLAAITNLSKWLSDEETNKHKEEKKSILALVLEGYKFDESLTIIDIVKNIEEIDKAIRSQYNLYLEDFSYEKFVKKLEENSEKFISRINESITKVLSQVLALPIAAAAPAILNGIQPNADNSKLFIAYMGLFAYSVICYFALLTQHEVLKNIKTQVENYDTLGKIPTSLQSQWTDDKKKIHNLIKKQENLFQVMISIIYLVVLFCGFKICESLI